MSETGDGHFFRVVMLPREDVEAMFESQDADAPTPTHKGELVPITAARIINPHGTDKWFEDVGRQIDVDPRVLRALYESESGRSGINLDDELRKADRALVRDVKRRRAKHDKMKHDDWLHSLRRKAGGY